MLLGPPRYAAVCPATPHLHPPHPPPAGRLPCFCLQGRGRAEASPPGAADAAAPDPCPTWAAEHVEARADNKALAYKAQQAQRAPLALAFLGDSITEGLNACGRRLAAAESALGGAVGLFGVPGDCVENLAWRLGHGGMPRAAAYCIQIGTNDLSMGEAPRSLVAQVRARVCGAGAGYSAWGRAGAIMAGSTGCGKQPPSLSCRCRPGWPQPHGCPTFDNRRLHKAAAIPTLYCADSGAGAVRAVPCPRSPHRAAELILFGGDGGLLGWLAASTCIQVTQGEAR